MENNKKRRLELEEEELASFKLVKLIVDKEKETGIDFDQLERFWKQNQLQEKLAQDELTFKESYLDENKIDDLLLLEISQETMDNAFIDSVARSNVKFVKAFLNRISKERIEQATNMALVNGLLDILDILLENDNN